MSQNSPLRAHQGLRQVAEPAERHPLRVLLISPVPDLDPAGGDVTYTLELLRHPPPGVSYMTHAEAMAVGLIRERGRRSTGLAGRGRLQDLGLLLTQGVVNKARRREWLF